MVGVIMEEGLRVTAGRTSLTWQQLQQKKKNAPCPGLHGSSPVHLQWGQSPWLSLGEGCISEFRGNQIVT